MPDDDIRDRLIDAAIASLVTEGNVGVRVSRIARRAGLSTGAIYSNFDSRDELLAAAYARRVSASAHLPSGFSLMAANVFGSTEPDFDMFYESLASVCDSVGENVRLETMDALLASVYSPVTFRTISPILRSRIESVAERVALSQRHGVTRSDIHPLALAVNWVATGMATAGVAALLRDSDDDVINEAMQQAMFHMHTAFFVDRPSGPWSEPCRALRSRLAGAKLPAAQPMSESAAALIESAGHYLRQAGNIELSVAKVAAEAGLTTGALYSQFRNREGLIAAVYLNRLDQAPGHAAGPISTARIIFASDDPSHELAQLLPELAKYPAADRRLDVGSAIAEARYNGELRGPMRARTAALVAMIAEIVEEGQQAGLVTESVDAYAQAVAWIGCTIGVGVLAKQFRPITDPEIAAGLLNGFGVMLAAFRNDPLPALLQPADIVDAGLLQPSQDSLSLQEEFELATASH